MKTQRQPYRTPLSTAFTASAGTLALTLTLAAALAPLLPAPARAQQASYMQSAAAPAMRTTTPAPLIGGPAAPAANINDDPNYKISPEDVLDIDVVNFSQLAMPQATVTPDGFVSAPLIGSVHVAGLTPDQTARLLAKKWSYYVVRPSVSVSLFQKHLETVMVTGFVNRPGAVTYHGPEDALTALADAGGPLQRGNTSIISLTSPDGSKRFLNLDHPEIKGGTMNDPPVLPGDILYVPEQRGEVAINGEVQHPGSMDYKNGITVQDVITNAGGTLDDADLGSASITHEGVTKPIDLYAMEHDGDMSHNVAMLPGDSLLIPKVQRTYVNGYVNKPGYYTYKPGDRVADALGAAGGALTSGQISDIRVLHVDPKTRNATLYKSNMLKYFHDGDASQNLALQPGDYVYVPYQNHHFEISDLGSALNGVNLLYDSAGIAHGDLGR